MPIALNRETGAASFLDQDGQWKPARTAVNPQTKEMMAFDGAEWKAVPAKSGGVLKYIDDAVRSLASGATFGFADELAAGANALLGIGDYETNLAAEQARDADIPTALRVPGQIAGAIGGTVAAAPVLGPAAVAAGVGKLPTVARAALAGTAGGAAFGAGEAEPGTRGEGAVKGALTGGVVGASAVPFVRGGAAIGDAVRRAMSPRRQAAADLQRAVARDADTPLSLAGRLADASKDRQGVATLADVGGENVRGLVERVAQTPGAGRTKVIPALTGRQQSQLLRVGTDLGRLTKTSDSAVRAIQKTIEQRATAAKPLYEAAYNFQAEAVPEIVEAWARETGQGWGRSVLNSTGLKRTLQTEYGIQDVVRAPLMVLIDAWKKSVDDLVGAAPGSNQSRVLAQMRDRVLAPVDQANPVYAQARNAWAGPSRYLEAIESGRGILSSKTSAEELRATLAAMSEAEREGFRIGAVSAIRGKMGSDSAKLGDMTKYLRSPEMREKVAAIMPTEEAADAWRRRLDFEVGLSELTARSLGNSATARRLAELEDSKGIAGDIIVDALAGSPVQSLWRQVVVGAPKKVRDTLRSRSDRVLADILLDPNAGRDIEPLLTSIIRRQASQRGTLPSAATASGLNALLLDR